MYPKSASGVILEVLLGLRLFAYLMLAHRLLTYLMLAHRISSRSTELKQAWLCTHSIAYFHGFDVLVPQDLSPDQAMSREKGQRRKNSFDNDLTPFYDIYSFCRLLYTLSIQIVDVSNFLIVIIDIFYTSIF